MDKSSDYWEQRRTLIINELKQGRQLAKQLQFHLNSPNETREFLLHEMIKSYDKALSILGSKISAEPTNLGRSAIGTLESTRSLSWSPQSQDSDPDHDNRDIPSKKRKSMPRWTQQVQVSQQGTGLEGIFDDGFNWRKYGQKDILGAKYPRGYYRCTHRNAQGCLATKQVQKSDEDSTTFEISYRGRHTCTQASLLAPPPPPPQETLPDFQTGHTVKTDILDTYNNNFPPIHFPPTNLDVANNAIGNFSPPFVSPATSSSNYFTLSPTRVSGTRGGSDYDLHEIISASTSATNSPMVGVDHIPFGHVELGSNFTFHNSGFFS